MAFPSEAGLLIGQLFQAFATKSTKLGTGFRSLPRDEIPLAAAGVLDLPTGPCDDPKAILQQPAAKFAGQAKPPRDPSYKGKDGLA